MSHFHCKIYFVPGHWTNTNIAIEILIKSNDVLLLKSIRPLILTFIEHRKSCVLTSIENLGLILPQTQSTIQAYFAVHVSIQNLYHSFNFIATF